MERLQKRKSNEDYNDIVQIDIAKYSILGKECASKEVLKHNYIYDIQKENSHKESESLKEIKSFNQFIATIQNKSDYIILKK